MVINDEFTINCVALLDLGVDQNCIQEGLIPSWCYEKTNKRLFFAGWYRLNVKYKLS